ncbi:MAG: hypothetical protein M3O32_11435 [Actinomycetota bacterium]|nr:hypothetical protein [Actinomycetota bacterium]
MTCCWHDGLSGETCCICALIPCGQVSAQAAVDHAQQQLKHERATFDREIAYAVEHGARMPNPWEVAS